MGTPRRNVARRARDRLLARFDEAGAERLRLLAEWLADRPVSVLLKRPRGDGRAGAYFEDRRAIELHFDEPLDVDSVLVTLAHEAGHLCNRDAKDPGCLDSYEALARGEATSGDVDRIWREEVLAWARGAGLLVELGVVVDMRPAADRALDVYRARFGAAGHSGPFEVPPTRVELTHDQRGAVLALWGGHLRSPEHATTTGAEALEDARAHLREAARLLRAVPRTTTAELVAVLAHARPRDLDRWDRAAAEALVSLRAATAAPNPIDFEDDEGATHQHTRRLELVVSCLDAAKAAAEAEGDDLEGWHVLAQLSRVGLATWPHPPDEQARVATKLAKAWAMGRGRRGPGGIGKWERIASALADLGLSRFDADTLKRVVSRLRKK